MLNESDVESLKQNTYPLESNVDEMFADCPEGIILLEQHGRVEMLRVHKMLAGLPYSFAYGLDHGDDPSQWGIPVALLEDDKFAYLGEVSEATFKLANHDWFHEYSSLFAQELSFPHFGYLPFLRAARQLNELGRKIGIVDVLDAIQDAHADWEARTKAAAEMI